MNGRIAEIKDDRREKREKAKLARRQKRQAVYDFLWVRAEHLAPPGADIERARLWYLITLVVCGVAMFMQFVSTWNVAYGNLFEWTSDGKQMRFEAVLPGFRYLIRGTYRWFVLVMVYLLSGIIDNYVCYYRESKSIYVMKRLPDRMEIHKRAWTLPLLAVLGILLAIGVITLLCLLVYLLCSPWECIPEPWFQKLIGGL